MLKLFKSCLAQWTKGACFKYYLGRNQWNLPTFGMGIASSCSILFTGIRECLPLLNKATARVRAKLCFHHLPLNTCLFPSFYILLLPVVPWQESDTFTVLVFIALVISRAPRFKAGMRKDERQTLGFFLSAPWLNILFVPQLWSHFMGLVQVFGFRWGWRERCIAWVLFRKVFSHNLIPSASVVVQKCERCLSKAESQRASTEDFKLPF